MKITKENAIASVQNSVSSIFSKDDVLFILNSIEGGGRRITTEDIQRAIDQTIDWMESNTRDFVDSENAEFEIAWGNKLEVTEVPINFDEIRDALENNFMDFGEDETTEENNEVIEAIADNEL